MLIEDQKKYFNQTFESWKEISNEKEAVIKATIDWLGIAEGDSVLDVGAGQGVLYSVLKDKHLSRYVALDISENMLIELKKTYPEAETVCGDFDKAFEINGKFDYVIIFNSIPHFEDLETVFSNAMKHLKDGGVFSIVHSKTREGLRQHHKNIEFQLGREAIPSDLELEKLTNQFGCKEQKIGDELFFYFSCRK
jgi:2-polyprenyl-3-methyl-5-hydroxy-6-metoxy-1,4-benzoquinol methylase